METKRHREERKKVRRSATKLATKKTPKFWMGRKVRWLMSMTNCTKAINRCYSDFSPGKPENLQELKPTMQKWNKWESGGRYPGLVHGVCAWPRHVCTILVGLATGDSSCMWHQWALSPQIAERKEGYECGWKNAELWKVKRLRWIMNRGHSFHRNAKF